MNRGAALPGFALVRVSGHAQRPPIALLPDLPAPYGVTPHSADRRTLGPQRLEFSFELQLAHLGHPPSASLDCCRVTLGERIEPDLLEIRLVPDERKVMLSVRIEPVA